MSQDAGQRDMSRRGELWKQSESEVSPCQRRRRKSPYIRINVKIRILEHGSCKEHHLREHKEVFEVVRDFLSYELHEVWY